jgi:hypothetical protein
MSTSTIFTDPQDYTVPASTLEHPVAEHPVTIAPTAQEQQDAVQKMMDASALINKTVFLKTRFGAIGNARKVSGAEVLKTDADAALLKVSKTLLDSAELDAIKKEDGKMRAWLYNTCLPFDMGIMLLPIGLIETAEAKMKAYKIERAALVEKFITAYPGLCAEAAQHLGSLFEASEYPTVDEIRKRYTFDWQYTTFSVPGQLKNISSALFEAEQQKAAATMQAATEEITSLMRETLLKLVSHLQARLSPGDEGKPKILRESAVDNLTQFLNTFDLRNVTNDADLASQVAKARALIGGHDANALRNSDVLKTQVLAGLDSIMDSLSGMVEEKPGRKFRDEE